MGVGYGAIRGHEYSEPMPVIAMVSLLGRGTMAIRVYLDTEVARVHTVRRDGRWSFFFLYSIVSDSTSMPISISVSLVKSNSGLKMHTMANDQVPSNHARPFSLSLSLSLSLWIYGALTIYQQRPDCGWVMARTVQLDQRVTV